MHLKKIVIHTFFSIARSKSSNSTAFFFSASYFPSFSPTCQKITNVLSNLSMAYLVNRHMALSNYWFKEEKKLSCFPSCLYPDMNEAPNLSAAI